MPSVRIVVNPRSQPFDESMDSLYEAVRFAQNSGYGVWIEKVLRGTTGYRTAGPLFAHFLSSSDTHMFMAADDMLYPPDTIVRLIADDKDVVSGIYRKNNLNRVEPANWDTSGEDFLKHYREGGVYETDFVGGHTMTIKREVIEKMVKDYPELEFDHPLTREKNYGLFLPLIENRVAYDDDWSFSIRARRSGFKLWTDFSVKLKHWCGDFIGFEAGAANGN